nr:hypothetical protein [Burkholderia pseudomallei]
MILRPIMPIGEGPRASAGKGLDESEDRWGASPAAISRTMTGSRWRRHWPMAQAGRACAAGTGRRNACPQWKTAENGGKRQKAREDAATRPLGMKGRAFAALRHRCRANADSFT